MVSIKDILCAICTIWKNLNVAVMDSALLHGHREMGLFDPCQLSCLFVLSSQSAAEPNLMFMITSTYNEKGNHQGDENTKATNVFLR